MDNNIKEYSKKYKALVKSIELLEEEIEESEEQQKKELKKRMIELNHTFDLFIDEYAKCVFDIYSKKKIQIKDTYTGEIKSWEEFFGDEFNKIPKIKRECLVGLIEKYGAYRIM